MPSLSQSDAQRRVLHDLTRRGLLRRVVPLLQDAGVDVMPLKGTLLAHWVYDRPADRLGLDVDLLVGPTNWSVALSTFEIAGFEIDPPLLNPHERTVRGPLPLPIDLHRELFAPGQFRLRASDLFARGCVDESLFDVPVVLPDPYDAFSHTIGHAAASHEWPITITTRDDLARMAETLKLEPQQTADRLSEAGLARAARYVLEPIASDYSFEQQILASLPKDAVGTALVGLAHAIACRFPRLSLPARVAGHLLNASVAQVAKASLAALAIRISLLASHRRKIS